MDTLDRIQDIINYIENNLDENISVSEVASKSGISSWQFQKIFRKATGDSLGNYIRHRRLSSAAEDLLNSDSKIIDIAINYQFNSQEAFTRAFKNYFNMTPARFKKSERHFHRKTKPQITPELLNHLNEKITQIPKILTLPERKIIGCSYTLKNVFSETQDFLEILKDHWSNFIKRLPEIQTLPSLHRYGVLKDDSCFDDDNFIYFSGVEVMNYDHIPKGLETYTLPAQTYAVFQSEGRGENSAQTMDYIYGIWLPQSEFKRDSGDDYELFDQGFSLDSKNSYYYYYLPVTPR